MSPNMHVPWLPGRCIPETSTLPPSKPAAQPGGIEDVWNPKKR